MDKAERKRIVATAINVGFQFAGRDCGGVLREEAVN